MKKIDDLHFFPATNHVLVNEASISFGGFFKLFFEAVCSVSVVFSINRAKGLCHTRMDQLSIMLFQM